MEKTIKQTVMNIIGECAGTNAIEPHMSLKNDLNLDSLDILEILMALESEFDCYIADAAAEQCTTVGDTIQLVETTKNQKG